MPRNRPASAQSRTAWSDDGVDNPGADMPAAMEEEDYDMQMQGNTNNSNRRDVQVQESNSCLAKFGRGIRCKYRMNHFIINLF